MELAKNDWPKFQWDAEQLAEFEEKFLHQSGIFIGASRHINEEEKNILIIDIITDEAIKTSEIEGEILHRDSVQVSIRRNFGLESDHRRVEPAEQGIADMMTDLYQNYDAPLSHSLLHQWHKMITNGRNDLKEIGNYRTHTDPMQVVSGPIHRPIVHFEAPPSHRVYKEMEDFLYWYSRTAPGKSGTIPALTRAGIAHLYFVSIHPYEDANGRIARALAEKSLSEYLKNPTLNALSQTIQHSRKKYYNALEHNNKDMEITQWLAYFAQTILDAQNRSLDLLEFLIQKNRFYDQAKGKMNFRQEKVVARIFREGMEGFKGGLSAENYLSITSTSRATATRDLQDLVEKGILIKTGELKSTRYHLNL